MAKRGRKPAGVNYKKIADQTVKELAEKKKALIRAEKAFARAKQEHEKLVAEVARLDMAERSLRAMAEGTEPPVNVRYVYSYPQWAWTYPNQWYPYWNGNTYTITLGQPQTTIYNAQMGNLSLAATSGSQQFTTSNAVNLTNVNTCGAFTTTSGSSLDSGSISGAVLSSDGSNGLGWTSVPTTGVMTTTNASTSDFTVDLSTGAVDPETETVEVSNQICDAEEK